MQREPGLNMTCIMTVVLLFKVTWDHNTVNCERLFSLTE